jgi:hypothetical protein
MIPFICRKPSAKAPVFSSPGRRQFSASLVYATTSSLKSIALADWTEKPFVSDERWRDHLCRRERFVQHFTQT